MKLHARHWIVERAYLDIDSAVSEAMRKHKDLTYLELFHCLTRITLSWANYGVKDEWYPDQSEGKEGGEER